LLELGLVLLAMAEPLGASPDDAVAPPAPALPAVVSPVSSLPSQAARRAIAANAW